MVVIELTYKVPLSEVDQHLEAHREFLKKHYDKGIFILSGAKTPREGGVIIAYTSLAKAKELVRNDPFYQYKAADYHFVEFEASRCSPEFESKLL